MVAPQIQDQIYQIFIQEALELLQQIEASLLEFLHNNRLPKINDLERAAHTIKGEAAQLNLPEIQTLAHRLENVFRSVEQKHLEIDSDLAQVLVQAQEHLQWVILAQLQIGQYDGTSALAKAESVFAQLEAKLDRNLKTEANLPKTTEVEVDIIRLIFNTEVPQALESLEKVLVHPEAYELAEEIKPQVEVLLDLGQTLGISQFVAIAQTTLDTLKATPQAALSIGQMAIAGFRAAQEVILASDLTTETLKEHTLIGESQAAVSDANAVAPAALLPETKLIIEDEVIQSLEQTSGSLLPYQAFATSTAQSDSIDFAPEPLPVAPALVLKTNKLFVWQADSIVFVLPYNSIAENLIPKNSQIIQSGRQRFLHWQERMIPIYRLSELLNNSPQATTSPIQALVAGSSLDQRAALMLVIYQEQQILALESAIEHLITKPELVIKPFGVALVSSSYCYGFTHLEDDRLLQVINVAALLSQTLGLGETAPDPRTFFDSLDTASVDKAALSKTKSSMADQAPVILVVDDSKTWRQSLAFTLQKVGYQIVQAQDGQEGIKQLQQNSLIQLVISDINMPNLNGFEFLFYCRHNSVLAKVPVIMLSIDGGNQYQQIAMHLGANAYFTKPYKVSELLAATKTLIEQNRRKSSWNPRKG